MEVLSLHVTPFLSSAQKSPLGKGQMPSDEGQLPWWGGGLLSGQTRTMAAETPSSSGTAPVSAPGSGAQLSRGLLKREDQSPWWPRTGV